MEETTLEKAVLKSLNEKDLLASLGTIASDNQYSKEYQKYTYSQLKKFIKSLKNSGEQTVINKLRLGAALNVLKTKFGSDPKKKLEVMLLIRNFKE